MDIKPIKTDADYHAALKEIESLMIAGPDTPEGEKLDVMVTLIEAYEAKHFPMDLPDPVEAIKFEMERKGLTVKDLDGFQSTAEIDALKWIPIQQTPFEQLSSGFQQIGFVD